MYQHGKPTVVWSVMKKSEKSVTDELILKINEIFFSIQGESTFAGRPCVFVRLTYCNLRCSYCDTSYAFFEGSEMSIGQILLRIREFGCSLVEITGGEPLIQKNVYPLMSLLCDNNYEVLLETAGHMDISKVDHRVRRIMDLKCPSSGESEKMLWSNINHLRSKDEVKFVAGDSDDLNWIEAVLKKYRINEICTVLISPVHGRMSNRRLADWILEKSLPVRMQIQMHKQIWEPDARGR